MPRAQGAFALPIDLIVSQRSVPKENGGALRAHTAEEHEITTCTRYARGILKCTGVLFYETHSPKICPLVSRWAGRLVASKSKGPAQLIK